MSRTVSWCLLVVWCAWLFALQGVVASTPSLALWTPDLGIVLLLALDRRFDRADAFMAVGVVSGARISFTSDAPLAILVGYAALVYAARRLRRVSEIDRLLPRAFLAALAAAALTAYWAVTRSIAFAADSAGVALGVRETLDVSRVSSAALATGIAAVVLGPLIVRLPGISPLRARSHGGVHPALPGGRRR